MQSRLSRELSEYWINFTSSKWHVRGENVEQLKLCEKFPLDLWGFFPSLLKKCGSIVTSWIADKRWVCQSVFENEMQSMNLKLLESKLPEFHHFHSLPPSTATFVLELDEVAKGGNARLTRKNVLISLHYYIIVRIARLLALVMWVLDWLDVTGIS